MRAPAGTVGARAAAGVQRATCVYNYAYNSTTRCHLLTVPPYSRLLLHGQSLSGHGIRTYHVVRCRYIGMLSGHLSV